MGFPLAASRRARRRAQTRNQFQRPVTSSDYSDVHVLKLSRGLTKSGASESCSGNLPRRRSFTFCICEFNVFCLFGVRFMYQVRRVYRRRARELDMDDATGRHRAPWEEIRAAQCAHSHREDIHLHLVRVRR